MMPKGVEHMNPAWWQSESTFVGIPMMPKGVEHSKDIDWHEYERRVGIPMMPKGVEHRRYSTTPSSRQPWEFR